MISVRTTALAVLACIGATAAVARGQVTLRSDTAPVEVTLPDGWAQSPKSNTGNVSPDVALTASDAAAGLWCAVVFEPKRHTGLTLDDYAAAVLLKMGKRSSDLTHTDWQHVRVGQADGLQCDVHLSRAKYKLAYVVTVFGSADAYDQVLAWTVESRFAADRAALAGVAAGFRQTGPAPAAGPPRGGPVTIRAKDGAEEIVLPAGWARSKSQTARATQLLAVNADDGQYVQLISESRKDIAFTLQEYAEGAVKILLRSGTDGSHTEWKPLTVGGHDALRCDVRLTVSGMRLAYVLTVRETPDSLEEVLAWTTAAAFDAAKPTLEGLADDLRPVQQQQPPP